MNNRCILVCDDRKRAEQLLSLCDALEARLQFAEEERGRLMAAVMSTVGG